MTKKVSSKRPREDLKPRPLPVPVKMLSYASRIRLRANEPTGPSQLKAVKVMADILDKKKIPTSEAAQVIGEARDAAENHRLERWRSENRRAAATRALKDLDELILKTEGLGDAISALPPGSKGHLNRKTAHLVKDGIFDADMFVDLIDLLADSLPDLSPQKKADDVRRIIERHEGESSPRIVRLWESMPWFTRDRVERRIKSSPSRSCVELFRALPNLLGLDEFRPPPRRGAPRFLLREYVRDIDCIWLRLNLTGRRRYAEYVESEIRGRHVDSPFQIFCNAGLCSVGDPTTISIRQVSNLKRGAAKKRRQR
jgi:hypothetical protein